MVNYFPCMFFDSNKTIWSLQNQSYVDNKDNKTKYSQVNVTSNVFKQATIGRLGQDMVGTIRLHTVHTNRKTCRSPKEFNSICYESSVNSQTINNSDFGSLYYQQFVTASQMNESYNLIGELLTITGDGYTVDFYPKNTTAEMFASQLTQMKDMFFHDSARGIVITMTTYSPKTDMWTANIAFYEFGISELVISNYIRSYAFKPNFYESKDEFAILILDLVRISLTLTIVITLLITKVRSKLWNIFTIDNILSTE